MSDTLLYERLDELVDDCRDATCDWDDVLRRALAIEPPALSRPHRIRSRRALVWALASLLVILFATPAFGLLRDWIGRKDVPFTGKTAPFAVKREFADMSLGHPKSWDPQAIASESRKVTVFKAFGNEYVLYVAPTRKGGFCWTINGVGGSCARRPTKLSYPGELAGNVNSGLLGVMIAMQRVPGTRAQFHGELAGVVTADNVASLRVEYEDHSWVQVPFVYVSKPIDAGFFLWGRPSGHRQVGKRPLAVSARDAEGKLIARVVVLHDVRRPSRTPPAVVPVPPKPLPWQAQSVPKAPFQRGSAEGVSVVVGKNGVVVIDTSHAATRVQALIEPGASWDCLAFFGPYHESDPTGLAMPLQPRISRQTMVLRGIPMPVAGCEISGYYGRRWRDPLATHRDVEIPLTARGKRYFADRAAADDLEEFVHLLHARGISKMSGVAIDSAISRNFGTEITRLASSSSLLVPRQIGYVHLRGGVIFYERSTTGRRFSVTIEHGRLGPAREVR
jgi:hypothetical protein